MSFEILLQKFIKNAIGILGIWNFLWLVKIVVSIDMGKWHKI